MIPAGALPRGNGTARPRMVVTVLIRANHWFTAGSHDSPVPCFHCTGSEPAKSINSCRKIQSGGKTGASGSVASRQANQTGVGP
jgi:hypothetical protein